MPKFVPGPVWFSENLAVAKADAELAAEDAGEPTEGASGRSAAAQRDLEDLRYFEKELTRLMKTDSFASLPRAWHWIWRIPNGHVLEVGNWRGHFGVFDHAVYGLLFSRAPHDPEAIKVMLARMTAYRDWIRKWRRGQ